MIDKISVYESVEDLCKGFTSFLQQEQTKAGEINISLSGGSTPKVIFDYWANSCQESINWQNIRFFWGDERCVPPQDEMSNYGMTKEHLFSKISTIPQKKIFRIHGENEPMDEALFYSGVLNKLLGKQNGEVSFDILILGLGDDGHTASIFPDQIDLWNADANCIVVHHPDTKMKRISITGKVINNARNVAFLVTGKNKADKVRQIIRQRKQFSDVYPAARVNPESRNLYWFLDKDAASLL